MELLVGKDEFFMSTSTMFRSHTAGTSRKAEKDVDMALYRRKIKEMMFLYMALHQGWSVQMLPDKTFKFTKTKN